MCSPTKLIVPRLLLASMLLGACQGIGAERVTDTQLKGWVEGLRSEDYAVREWATEKLRQAGPAAIGPIAAKLASFDVESTIRGLSVIESFAMQEDTTSVVAEEALRQLASERATASSQRARDILKAIVAGKPRRAERALRRLGAHFDLATSSYANAYVLITIGEQWHGSVKDLQHLRSLSDYREIAVKAKGKAVNDQWMESLAEIPNLAQLTLNTTSVTDRGIAQITKMQALKHIRVYYSDITDGCLKSFDTNNSNLQSVYAIGTQITFANFQAMDDAQPKLLARFGLGGFLGIAGRGLSDLNTNPETQEEGCLVTDVTANEAASRADIRVKDIILEYNGHKVSQFVPPDQRRRLGGVVLPQPQNDGDEKPTGPSLSELIGKNQSGDRVKVTIKRNGAYLTKEVLLGKWP